MPQEQANRRASLPESKISRPRIPMRYSQSPMHPSLESRASANTSEPPPYSYIQTPGGSTPGSGASYENRALLHGPSSGNPASSRSVPRTSSNSEHPFNLGLARKIGNSNRVLPPAPYLLQQGPEKDDKLHEPGPPAKRRGPSRLIPDSTYIRGRIRYCTSCTVICNFLALVFLATLTVFAFLGYPLLDWLLKPPKVVLNYRGAGPTVPFIKGGRGLLDIDTPLSAYQKTGVNGEDLRLVFSDEFNADGRSFFPGDDPYWEAVDLHYAATGDLEWYNPDQITTADGNLVITIKAVDDPSQNHNLDYVSGMLQSWSKFCFSGGLLEARISLPGKVVPTGTGSTFWSAFWMMGNLGRPGYRATTDGIWPYTYDTCDVGTLHNQSYVSYGSDKGPNNPKGFSYLPGQRLSSCTCSGEDHPGPQRKDGTYLGRGAPEIDVFEIQNDVMSQSNQNAPFNQQYAFDGAASGTYKIQADDDPDKKTFLNSWRGNAYQQAASGITKLDPDAFEQSAGTFDTYGVQYSAQYQDGFITWLSGDNPNWSIYKSAYKADPRVEIGPRMISTEPMAIVLNVALSQAFGGINIKAVKEQLPAKMRVDWIRVYQENGKDDVGCDPYYAPTTNYIEDHPEAYQIWNNTIWSDAGYAFPKNNLVDQC